MSQPSSDAAARAPAAVTDTSGQMQSLLRRLFPAWKDKNNGIDALPEPTHKGHGLEQQGDNKAGVIRRVSRKVVPGLPRAQTFKRQLSEVRSRLEPVQPTPAERRAVSMDRRVQESSSLVHHSDPRASAPDFLHHCLSDPSSPTFPMSPVEDLLDTGKDFDYSDLDRDSADDDFAHDADALSKLDIQSMTTSQYDALIESELERKWILNLSMHFRDKSKREKFFVTFRQHEHVWRRVTLSLDYRNAPENSLEAELAHTHYQREKSARIYEAIRDSLAEIDFYSTVTNLKLKTDEGRLHVHVVEDVNEVINYPPVRMIQHMNCRRVKEREIHFDAHMSGFVYRVRVHGRLLIKKEIPGPDTVDEFLYEINALHQLAYANNVIQFYGVVVDDRDEHVTGLLISYASHGALIDVIYDNDHSLPWPTREKWARQIVGGLSEIHEAGFVQGDFTLSNIVIDENDDAKIIDINRRGCPIGWEPPEATPLIESNQRISMYIGVKSDLYQLGMVLWALATQEDEPDACGRPLTIDPEIQVPPWYRHVVDTCLSVNPRNRVQAVQLLSRFPDSEDGSQYGRPNDSSMSLNGDGRPHHGYLSPTGIPRINTVPAPSDWAYVGWGSRQLAAEPFHYPSRGRSPPSPMPSNQGDYDASRYKMCTWSETFNNKPAVPFVSDVPPGESREDSELKMKGAGETMETYADGLFPSRGTATDTSRDNISFSERGRSFSTEDRCNGMTESSRDGPVSQEKTTTWGPPHDDWRLREQSVDPGTDDGSQSPGPGNRGNTGPQSQADSGKDVTELASTPREHREHFPKSIRQRSVSRGRTGRSSAESSRQSGQQRAARTTTTTTTTTDAFTYDRFRDSNSNSNSRHLNHDYDLDSRERTQPHPYTPFAPPPTEPPTQPQSGFRHHSDDDLKGIGSAYDPPPNMTLGNHHTNTISGNSGRIDNDLDEKRQREMILGDDDDDYDHEGLSSELDKSLKRVLATADDKGASVLPN